MEIEHIVIRYPRFVTGSEDKPEVRVFVQTNSRCIPLHLEKLKSGQIVWMKYVSGPIVAKAKIDSWHSGRIENGNINPVRELTSETKLYDLDEYWDRLSKKKYFFYFVVKLYDEKWLKQRIKPKVRSYGNTWIFLDNEEKKRLWLSN